MTGATEFRERAASNPLSKVLALAAAAPHPKKTSWAAFAVFVSDSGYNSHLSGYIRKYVAT